MRLQWSAKAPTDFDRALRALASRVSSLGHSSSFARFAFLDHTPEIDPLRAWRPNADGDHVLRVPYAGRLRDLERWFSTEAGKRSERPRTRCTSRYAAPGGVVEPMVAGESIFGGEGSWFVFEGCNGFFCPDILGFAHVARRLRDVLMKVGPQPSPEILSGHAVDGGRSLRPHIAIVPLANIGWEYATGDLLGLAICLPRSATPEERGDVVQALGRFVRTDGDVVYGELEFFSDRRKWRLERSMDPSRASLKPARWCKAARTWASVTPVLLDRFPDHGDAREEARIIATACHNIGLPEPVEIEIHKHSAVRGAPSAYPARGAAHRPDWTFPTDSNFRNRPRRHVVLRFEAPVEGPVVLGAGRFYGMGLCLPFDRKDDDEGPRA